MLHFCASWTLRVAFKMRCQPGGRCVAFKLCCTPGARCFDCWHYCDMCCMRMTCDVLACLSAGVAWRVVHAPHYMLRDARARCTLYMLQAASCMLQAACRKLHVASCMLHATCLSRRSSVCCSSLRSASVTTRCSCSAAQCSVAQAIHVGAVARHGAKRGSLTFTMQHATCRHA